HTLYPRTGELDDCQHDVRKPRSGRGVERRDTRGRSRTHSPRSRPAVCTGGKLTEGWQVELRALLHICIVQPSTPIAAWRTASANVGWAWLVRAISSD